MNYYIKQHYRVILRASICICFLLTLLILAYLTDFYPAQQEAWDVIRGQHAITDSNYENEKNVQYIENQYLSFRPSSEKDMSVGLILYPGGKVAFEAYAPLGEECAEYGITTIVPHMPFNLAMFDLDAAEKVMRDFPEIKSWYIGGHSLGGVMAASYVAEHIDQYSGLILLASYSTEDLNNSKDFKVLSIYGTEDGVLNMDSYEKHRDNLPNLTEAVIDGGNHACFGCYGSQEGDGIPSISFHEQIEQTAESIHRFVTE